jgi:hypothetical protein
LGVGLHNRFLPTIQISLVALENWQQRFEQNALEASYILVSSVLVLPPHENLHPNRNTQDIHGLKKLNPVAKVKHTDHWDVLLLLEVVSYKNIVQKFDHQKAHWASRSVDVPDLVNTKCIHFIYEALLEKYAERTRRY